MRTFQTYRLRASFGGLGFEVYAGNIEDRPSPNPDIQTPSISTSASCLTRSVILQRQQHDPLRRHFPPSPLRPYSRFPPKTTTTATMSTARFGLRATQALRQPLRQNLRSPVQRRYQSTAEAAAQDAAKEQSGFSKFFNSPVGPKTVHFWAPIMKVRHLISYAFLHTELYNVTMHI